MPSAFVSQQLNKINWVGPYTTALGTTAAVNATVSYKKGDEIVLSVNNSHTNYAYLRSVNTMPVGAHNLSACMNRISSAASGAQEVALEAHDTTVSITHSISRVRGANTGSHLAFNSTYSFFYTAVPAITASSAARIKTSGDTKSASYSDNNGDSWTSVTGGTKNNGDAPKTTFWIYTSGTNQNISIRIFKYRKYSW